MTFFNQVGPFYLAEPGPFLLDRLQKPTRHSDGSVRRFRKLCHRPRPRISEFPRRPVTTRILGLVGRSGGCSRAWISSRVLC
jgi:hypothetical protein